MSRPTRTEYIQIRFHPDGKLTTHKIGVEGKPFLNQMVYEDEPYKRYWYTVCFPERVRETTVTFLKHIDKKIQKEIFKLFKQRTAISEHLKEVNTSLAHAD